MNRELLASYNLNNRPPFTEELFFRDENEIIEEVQKVILSSQREGSFTIRVESFEVVEDYYQINRILSEYFNANKKKDKARRKENPYDHIDLKESDIKLLIVNYYIAIGDESGYIKSYIAIPRIIDRYYIRITGTVYSAIFQIVDGSTYNNLTSNSKYNSITMKTVFMPVKIYKYTDVLNTTKGDKCMCYYYIIRAFNKSLLPIKYFLAKYGLLGTMEFLGLEGIYLSNRDIDREDMYTFKLNIDLYVNVPKNIMNNDVITQTFIYTLHKNIDEGTNVNDIYDIDYWLIKLGEEFSNSSVTKGEAIIQSFESIYDMRTKEDIRLPEEYKKDIYHIVRWMIREYNYLRIKDNLDISTKKIRLSSYIAAMYANKLSIGIYRISDMQKKANLQTIIRALNTQPTYLLTAIENSNLVNYRNMVNDMDSLAALKFTYKGISGLGETNDNSIPDIYRAVNISHMGRVDIDSSSNSDPGVTGTICPYAKIYNKSFSKYIEPNFWESKYTEMMNTFKTASNIKEVATFKNKILNHDNQLDVDIADEALSIISSLIIPATIVDKELRSNVKLEEGGIITYESN